MQKRDEARELGLAVASIAVLVHFVDAGPAGVATSLVVAAAALGTGRLTGDWRPWRMPAIQVALPALAAFAIAGIARLVSPVPWLAAVFVTGWAVMVWVVRLETAPDVLTPRPESALTPAGARAAGMEVAPPTVRVRPRHRAEFGIAQIVTETVVVKTREVPPHPRPLAVRSVALGLAFAAFLAVGGLVPGGLVVAASGDAAYLSTQGLAAFIVVNAAIAGVIGYRLAGLLSPHRFDRIVRFVAVLQYAVAVGVAAGILRSMALPRLFIPALLTLVVYLVMAVRESPERVTLNKRLLQELAVLALAASAAIAWGLMAR
jgi:hypothetical protein